MTATSINARRWVVIVVSVYLAAMALYGLSAVAFLLWPQAFYFRAWEYIHNVLDTTDRYGLVWEGEEGFDLTRANFFLYANTRPTRVTMTADGYRATPLEPNPTYRIVIFGDSQAWGSGLDDSETIAWRLAMALHEPVLNAARDEDLCNVLRHPLLAPDAVVIYLFAERHLASVPTAACSAGAYVPIAKHDQPFEAVRLLSQTPPKTYFPLLRRDVIKRMANDLRTLLSGGPEDQLYFPYTLTAQNLAATAAGLPRLAKELDERGHAFLFASLPSKETLFGVSDDGVTRGFLRALYQALDATSMTYVNLLDPLLERGPAEVYFPYDTHVSPEGARIAAEEIIAAVRRITDVPVASGHALH
jgi:hypothetical protein